MRMNLSEAIATWAERNPEFPAITGSNVCSYRELNQYINSVAVTIKTRIEGSGNKIAILIRDNISFIASLAAIIRTGNVYVLINPTLSADQISYSLTTIGCDFALAEGKLYLNGVECIEVALNKVQTQAVKNCEIGVLEDAGVIFSSGTTGEPKALMRSSYSILSEVIQWIIELQLVRKNTFLIPRPLYYTGGFILMYTSLFSGGQVILLDDLSTENVINFLEQSESVDWAFIVPAVIRELNQNAASKKMAKNVLTMGARIFADEKTGFHNKYNCNLIEVWGNSEGLGTITSSQNLESNPDAIGRAFFTDYVGVMELDESGDRCDVIGKAGLLYGASDNRFKEYIAKPELTKQILHDEFIFSEDIGYKDENGLFYLTGRVKEIIVVNGLKVFPKDIERSILKHPDVADVAVFNLLDRIGNDRICAALVTDSQKNVDEIIKVVNTQLAEHEKITIALRVDKIPRNHGGKVDTAILIEECRKRGF